MQNEAIEIETMEELPEERAQRHAVALGFFDGKIPHEIKGDRSLPPKRGELDRLLKWEARTRDEIVALQRRRGELVSAVNAPSHTASKLAALRARDLAALRTSSGPVNTVLTRTAEHDALVTRVRSESYAAEQARKVLRQVDLDIGSRTVGLRFLEMRHRKYVDAALVESATGLGEEYRRLVGELRNVILQLWGLGTAVRSSQFLITGSHNVRLPNFKSFGHDDDEIKIAADQHQLEVAAAPWQAVAEMWLQDPKRNDATGVYDAARKKGIVR